MLSEKCVQRYTEHGMKIINTAETMDWLGQCSFQMSSRTPSLKVQSALLRLLAAVGSGYGLGAVEELPHREATAHSWVLPASAVASACASGRHWLTPSCLPWYGRYKWHAAVATGFSLHFYLSWLLWLPALQYANLVFWPPHSQDSVSYLIIISKFLSA